MRKEERYKNVIQWFLENKPIAETELHYANPYQLLVAVILSAQCTDKRVNMVTPALFEAYPTPEAMAASNPDAVFSYIKSISYPNNKAKHLVGMAQTLVNEFQGVVPSDIKELMRLPGVGRKTANVIASVVFDLPAMAVDTHVFRVSNRIGLTVNSKTPLETEKELVKHIPEELIPKAHHWLILHGQKDMRIRPRDITIGLLLAITIALTFYFYKNLGIAKKSARIDLLTILPSEPKSILTLTKPIKNQKFSWNDSGIQKIFNNNIPQKWTEILRLQNELEYAQLSFHQGGSLLCVRTGTNLIDKLQKIGLFGYLPEKENLNNFTLYYFPDTEGRFMGCYQQGGLFVASYNKKMLIRALSRQISKTSPANWDTQALKSIMDNQKSPYFWIFQPQSLQLPAGQSPTWLSAELLINQDPPCCTIALPLVGLSDSTIYTIANDSLLLWANRLFPQNHTSAQIDQDRSVIFFTICEEGKKKANSETTDNLPPLASQY